MTTQGPPVAKKGGGTVEIAAGTVSGWVISKDKTRLKGKLNVQASWFLAVGSLGEQMTTKDSDVKLAPDTEILKKGDFFRRAYTIKNIKNVIVNSITVEARSADRSFAGSEEVTWDGKQGKVHVKISLDD